MKKNIQNLIDKLNNDDFTKELWENFVSDDGSTQIIVSVGECEDYTIYEDESVIQGRWGVLSEIKNHGTLTEELADKIVGEAGKFAHDLIEAYS